MLRDLNGYSIIWDSKKNKKDRILQRINKNLFLFNKKSQTHLDPSSVTYLAIYVTPSDPQIFGLHLWSTQLEWQRPFLNYDGVATSWKKKIFPYGG